MTVINPSSISGITSITMPSGDGNVLTIHTNDGVERFRIDSSGNVKVGSACTISPDGDVFFTGVCTATTLTGAASGLTGALPAISGANLTNLPAANLTGALPAIDGSNLTGVEGGKFNGTAAGIHTTSTVGIQTANVTAPDLVGAASSMVGLYIGDGHLLFSNYLNKSGGYYITTGLNALNAGPVTLGTSMKLDGTWVIV